MTDTIPGDLSTTATLTVGGSATDTIDAPGDHDWFKISLTAGQAVTVSVGLGTLEDSYLNIRDASGNIIYSNDDIVDGVERGSRISFMPPSTGTYYIDVGSYNDQYSGTCTVSVQPYTQPPLATNDQIAQQLVSGYWGGDLHHFNVTQGGTITVNISTLTSAEQNLALNALQEWSDIIGVHFQQVTTSNADIMFDDSRDSDGPIAATDATYSGGITTSAHVHISTDWVNNYGTSLDSYSFQSYVHEIGHALGLGHSGDYNTTADFPYDAKFLNDSWSTSIMSYFDQHQNTYFNGLGFTFDYDVTPMAADIMAMQQLYGLSTTTRTDDTVYGFNSTAGGVYDASVYSDIAYTIFDSGGNDTLNFFRSPASQLINLNPETFSNVNGGVGNLVIARGVTIENAIGGKAADTIIGNSVDNVLTGNGGADTLTGGGGNDTFSDTETGHSGDTITDFHAGDSIVFTDATLNGFTFSLSGQTLSYSGGSLTLIGLPSGTFTANAAAAGGVQLSFAAANVTRLAHNDFNGDGKSDLLWWADSGTVTDWLGQSNGSFAGNGANFSTVITGNWHIVGTGDFNGDGYSDVLWRNDDGRITDWLGQSNGALPGGGANFSSAISTNWHVAGTADFNGDGKADILWRADDGTVTDWLGQATGGFAGNGSNFNSSISSNWQIAGTGDFNGDGKADILWRADDGTVTDWLGQTSGGFAGNGSNFNTNISSNWHIAGTGDFNGDGKADILWRADDGTVTDWLGQANGGFAGNGSNFNANVSTDWHVVSIGDFNGDGKDDIVWRNDNGTLTEWIGHADGTITGNGANVNIPISTDWHIHDPFVHESLI